jgi:hypothetical protein
VIKFQALYLRVCSITVYIVVTDCQEVVVVYVYSLQTIVIDSDGLIELSDKPLTTLQAYKNKNITLNIKLQ